MTNEFVRIENDSLGEVRVPAHALYMAQTQRAIENFPVSGLRFGRSFIRALGICACLAPPPGEDASKLFGHAATNRLYGAAAGLADAVS